MLVLSRRHRESVVVGGSNDFEWLVNITVLGIHKGKVRLGFEAGDDFPVHRWEVWERLRVGGRAEAG